MFDRYYCIKTNCDTWKIEIFEESEPVNLYFLQLKARGNGTFPACVLKTPLPGQIPTSCWRHVLRLLPCTLLTLTSLFMTALECIQLKQQSRLITLLPSLIARRWVGRQTQWWPRHKAIYFSWFGPELFCLLLGPPGFNCWFSSAPVFQWCCSTPQGSPGVGRNTFLSSPHLCFIIVFICDLFVSRDDPLMS